MSASITQIASVDAGNGGTKTVLSTGKGFKTLYMPSVRAAATGDSLGLGKGWELQYEYVDWYTQRYVVGDDVLRVTRRGVERHMGASRYGNEMHMFLTAAALAKLGVKEGGVDLTLFCPPGLYNDMKPFMEKRFAESGGRVEIKLKGDKQTRKWCYENVTVWPEGLGAAACFILDDTGAMHTSDVLTGDVVILDVGAYTLDALLLSGGNFNPESLQHATLEAGGTDTHIRQPIVRTLKKQAADFAAVTVEDVDRIIRQGAETGNYTLAMGGVEADLKPLIDRNRQRYAEWVSNNVADGFFDGFRGTKSVILVGGSDLIEDHMRGWYGDKILDRKSHPTTKKLHPIDMNAVGGMRLALARRNGKK